MIGSRTSMHTEFSTDFSTSHLTENCSIALPLKSWDEARYVIWAVGPVRSPDTCPASLWPTRRALDQKLSFSAACAWQFFAKGVSSPRACTPGNRDTFYGTREEGHALEEYGKSPEAARLDSAPSACVSTWECMGDKRSTVPISGCSNIP
jgi:hypothetical protein